MYSRCVCISSPTLISDALVVVVVVVLVAAVH
jgi:hypothetical protein